MSVEKVVKSMFAVLKAESEKQIGFGSELGSKLIDQLGKQVSAEIKRNPQLEASLADVLFPDETSNPVAVLQKFGEEELARRLTKLAETKIRRIAKESKLAIDTDFKSAGRGYVSKERHVAIVIAKAKQESGYAKGI